VEWWTQGYVVNYASGGTIPPFWGMLVGVIIVITYVALGGMRSVITANILQGLYMFFIGTGLLVWLVYRHFGGFGALFDRLATRFPEVLTYPGPGWDPPAAYWTSIVITSGLGGFMWPWVYNKLLAADSVRTIKQTVLLAPVLGTLFYGVFVILGMGLHTIPALREDPQQAYLALGADSGPIVLGLLAVLITAASVSTVSGILNAMSTAITNDIALVIKREISRQTAVLIARLSVVVIGLAALLGAVIQQGLLIFLALLTYQGMIMLFPVVILGLYWRRANKEGALLGFLAGTAVSFYLAITNPEFITTYGWSSGMYGIIVTVVVMVAAGLLKKEEPHVAELWNEVAESRNNRVEDARGVGVGSQ
jgi:solute:Na+ symporter, SSS family